MKLPLNQIIIGERQRIDLGDLHDLDSMSDKDIGQIQPIVVHKTLLGYELVDGRRRLAKATALQWPDIECYEKDQLTEVQKQKMELLADIGRKDRSWQETCIAVTKVYNIMRREKAADGEAWSIRQMARFTGYDKTPLSYMLRVAEVLTMIPRDEVIWSASNYTEAVKTLSDRAFAEAHVELERRRQAIRDNPEGLLPPLSAEASRLTQSVVDDMTPVITFKEIIPGSGVQEPHYNGIPRAEWMVQQKTGEASKSAVSTEDTTLLTLYQRADLFNQKYDHLGPPNTPMFYIANEEREFIHGFWFTGGGNVSDFYGSYQTEYLNRVQCMFPDFTGAKEVVHLFSGSLPPGPYTRVGMDPTGKYKSDFECDAHKLASFLPFNPSLIYADPPYSIEDSEHYQNSMVNRAIILEQCGLVLKSGGYVVWLDQALPVFSNNNLQLVGAIGFVRSTGNRFRLVSIFRKVEKKESEYV